MQLQLFEHMNIIFENTNVMLLTLKLRIIRINVEFLNIDNLKLLQLSVFKEKKRSHCNRWRLWSRSEMQRSFTSP